MRDHVSAASQARKPKGPPPPTGLSVKAERPGRVVLRWKAPKTRTKAKPASYLVLRNGKKLGTTTKTTYLDRSAAPGKTYSYTVTSLDKKKRPGVPSSAKRLKIPASNPGLPTPKPPTPVGSTNPPPTTLPPGDLPAPAPTPTTPLSTAMVDRLFWRAGFGPSDADRATWTGRDVSELVDFFLDTPNTLVATATPPLTQANGAIDPLVSDDDLVTEWIDRMQRSANPFAERLTLFWHRHWAVSREDGIPAQWMRTYAGRLRAYADLGAAPDATFRDLAFDMTTKDGAMSLFLNGTDNTKNRPNENYAREFMELFCLGVFDAQGNANYTQNDVKQLARAFTGWRVDQTPANPTYGEVSFVQSRFDTGVKTLFGQSSAFTAATAVDKVLAHPAHAPYLVRKLWGEFIASAPDDASVAAIASAYTGSGYKLKPLLRGILTHPAIFESLDEPNLIKPPVVYTVGILRALGVPLKWFWVPEALRNMQQHLYRPPNVAGWEGGLSWLNTNTVQARFDLLPRVFHLTYGNGYPGGPRPVADVPGESGQAAFDRAYAAAQSPWLSAGARAQILGYAGSAPAGTVTQRAQRQYALRALMLGGPDGQVM
jgi:uncharacterized protein (DUF1800 family)